MVTDFITKPWLCLPPSISHTLGPIILRNWSKLKCLPKSSNKKINKLGLEFSNPFGTAGGLDKEAKDLFTWTKWGAGFLEVGTFTPEPQGPNPGKIIGRDVKNKALWNCMGFPNAGFKAVLPRIKNYKKKMLNPTPLFINIGKNRTTPLEKAQDDYVKGIHFFNEVADCFVINISSPNTKDLRLLHQKENFKAFINPIIEAAESYEKKVPLLVKLSPDLDDEDFAQFLNDCSSLNIEGFILTNTTVKRPEGINFPERGGLSGAPLCAESLNKLKLARKTLGKDSKQILISVGGICSPEEALNRLNSGADLVQFYSGLLFHGPSLFKDSTAALKL